MTKFMIYFHKSFFVLDMRYIYKYYLDKYRQIWFAFAFVLIFIIFVCLQLKFKIKERGPIMIDSNSPLSSLDVQKILVFLSVMETRSFSKTAENLFLTQSGVSKTINRMEQILDIPLFIRSTRNVIPTAYAEMLYPAWKSVMERMDSSYQNAKESYDTNMNTINIAIPSTSNPHLFLWPKTDLFLSQNKEVRLNISNAFFKEQLQNTLDGMYDVSFLPHFDINTLEEHHFCWAYAAKNYAEAIVPAKNILSKKDWLVIEDLLDEKIVGMDPSVTENFNLWLREVWEAHGKEPNIGMVSTEPFVMHIFDRTNDLICIGDHYFTFPESVDVRRIPIRDIKNGIVMAWNPDMKKPSALKYIEYMRID